MKRPKGDEPRSCRARDIIRCLARAKSTVARLQHRGKAYDALIARLLTIGEEDSCPASKDLQTQLRISPARLKRWLKDLYTDFVTALREEADFLQLPQVEHLIILNGREGVATILCRLPVTPRVGEELRVPFLWAETSSDSYYVYQVRYEFEDGKVLVVISARFGSYNQHYHYLRDQAQFEKRLSPLTALNLDEYQIENLIRKQYPPGR